MLTIPLIFLLLAVAGAEIVLGVRERGEPARLLRERLKAINQAYLRNPTPELTVLREDIASSIPALNQVLLKSAKISRLQRWIEQAGLQLLIGKFLLVCACLGAAMGLLLMKIGNSALLGPVGLVLGSGIPVLYVRLKRQRRFSKFEASLPNAIDLLTRAVRAGHAFTTCLELVMEEMSEPLSGEFRKVYEEQRFGLPIREALLNLTERVPLLNVRILVTAILLQRETGGNLAETLDNLSFVMRERFKIQRQVRVFTAQGRLTMAILLAFPPACALLMTFSAPDLMRVFYADPIGKALIAIGLVKMTTGYFLIRKVIQIQV